MRKKYLRRHTVRFKRLGKNKKKKQIWRRPKGRDNKMRENRKGRPGKPRIGEKKPEKMRDKIFGKTKIRIRNIRELEKVKKGEIIVIAKLGKKKREALIKEIEKRNLEIVKDKQTKKEKKK